jgi:hypothetical protein
MGVSTLRRALCTRAGVAALAAVVAVGGQIAAGGPARALVQTRPPLAYVLDTGTGATPGNGSGSQCPCSVFPAYTTPGGVDSGDPYSVVVGVKVRPSVGGRIQGVRFYKSSANTGTHTGSLWTSDGILLATGTFTGETATGWQTLMFATPVPVKPGVTYVASYYAPNGHYSYDVGYFFNDPAGQAPITALANSTSGGNGVFSYGGASAFPSSSYNAANYWVDVIFDDADVPTTPPTVTGTTPGAGSTGVAATATVSATFSAPMDYRASVHFSVTDAAGGQVPGTVGFNADATTATFTPGTQLPAGTVFTASIQATDAWGNAMSAPFTWSFTTDTAPPSYQCPCSLFGTDAPPGVVDSNDPNSVELGVRFTPAVDGTVTGIRFYKGASASGVHTGTLWNASTGTTLETGTFTSETPSGWQTMTFDRPWPVTAGNTYYASYHAPAGHYSYTPGYFSYTHKIYPLTAPATASTEGNGLFGYGSAPVSPMGDSGNGTNYWVDVVFVTS